MSSKTIDAVAKHKATNKAWYEKNKKYVNTVSKLWRQANAVQARLRVAEWKAAHPGENNRLSKAHHTRMCEALAGRSKPQVCEVCGCSGKICFDHEHSTNLFRGWICFRCNMALGYVGDSASVLRKLAKYLDKHEAVKHRRLKDETA